MAPREVIVPFVLGFVVMAMLFGNELNRYWLLVLLSVFLIMFGVMGLCSTLLGAALGYRRRRSRQKFDS
jgi:hypothetical protein